MDDVDARLRDDSDDLVKLDFFTAVAASIAGAKSLRSTLQAVMDNIGSIFAPRNWSLFLRDPKSGELVFTIVIGDKAENLRGQRVRPGTGLVGWIAECRENLIIENVASDPRFDPSVDERSGFRTRSIIGVPLVSNGRVFGVIELVNELEDRPFTRLDLRVLRTIADFAAIAIERSYYLEALRRLSLVDSLTGIPNRRAFERALEHEKRQSKRNGRPFSVLVVDIDSFKTINDERGHEAGDNVLRRLAALLSSCTRQMDTAARIGGDEFVVLLPGADRIEAEEVRRRVIEAVSLDGSVDGIPFSVSVGLETGGGESADTVLSGADRDMYLAKQARFEGRAESVEENLNDFLDEEERSEH